MSRLKEEGLENEIIALLDKGAFNEALAYAESIIEERRLWGVEKNIEKSGRAAHDSKGSSPLGGEEFRGLMHALYNPLVVTLPGWIRVIKRDYGQYTADERMSAFFDAVEKFKKMLEEDRV